MVKNKNLKKNNKRKPKRKDPFNEPCLLKVNMNISSLKVLSVKVGTLIFGDGDVSYPENTTLTGKYQVKK